MNINLVNIKTHRKKPLLDFYIGHGSPLYNPYTAPEAPFGTVTNREEAKTKYRSYLIKKVKERDVDITNELKKILRTLKMKKQVNLVCFCRSNETCHGEAIRDVLLKLINKNK